MSVNVKLARLEDDLAREKFKDNLRMLNKQHRDRHKKLSDWIEARSACFLRYFI